MCSDSFWFKRKQIRKDILIILRKLIWFSSEVQTWELIRVFSAKIIKWSSQNASVGFSCIWIFLFGSLYIQTVSDSKDNNTEKIKWLSNTQIVVAADLSLILFPVWLTILFVLRSLICFLLQQSRPRSPTHSALLPGATFSVSDPLFSFWF